MILVFHYTNRVGQSMCIVEHGKDCTPMMYDYFCRYYAGKEKPLYPLPALIQEEPKVAMFCYIYCNGEIRGQIWHAETIADVVGPKNLQVLQTTRITRHEARLRVSELMHRFPLLPKNEAKAHAIED